VVIVSPGNVKLRPGANAALFQKFQEMAIALVDAADPVAGSRLGVGQQQQAAPAPAGRALQFAEIAMRTGSAAT